MDRPIRVLCVFSTLNRGGAESMCMNLYRHIDREKVQFDFVKHTPQIGAFEEMKEIAATLSKGMPFVRVDLYELNDRVYFSELTFFHGGGFSRFYPEEWEYKLGSWIEINH